MKCCACGVLTVPLCPRLKATLERLQRMTQLYVDSLLSVFSERAGRIGHALALEPSRIEVTSYDEDTVCGHKLSKYALVTDKCYAAHWLVPKLCIRQVFTEAEVRASVVFQLSELVSMLLKASRSAIGGSEWDALVAGIAAPPSCRFASV